MYCGMTPEAGIAMNSLASIGPAWIVCLIGMLAFTVCCVMAACLTPRIWWYRPSVLGVLGLAGGSCLIGWWLWQLAGLPDPQASTSTGTILQAAVPSGKSGTLNGTTYHTHRALNLRRQPGTDAALRATLPSASLVWPTGLRQGDWWQVGSEYGTGWVSSLWLRQHASPLVPSDTLRNK